MFSGVSWGFTVSDLISSVFDFIMLFDQFILLGAAILLAPAIVAFFRFVIRHRGGRRSEA